MDDAAVPLARGGQVREHLVLRVQPHGLPHQLPEVDAPTLAVEAQHRTLVLVAVTEHPAGHTGVREHGHRARLQDARPVGSSDLLAGARLYHHGVDARTRQQVREHQAGRARPHDRDVSLDDRSLLEHVSS